MGDEKVIQHNIGMYPEDWQEVEAIANAYYRGNRSFAMRMIIDFWRQNRVPSPQQANEEIENLMDGFEKDQVSFQEFKEQVLVLAGGK